MRLRLVYRSYGGENLKSRPPFYSKRMTLTSFIRASEMVPDAELVFLNDGPIPQDRLDLMQRHGTVHAIPGGPVGMRNSYRYGLFLSDQLGWDDGDVVSFIEDDYLFTADALQALDEAVRQLPEVAYFALNGAAPLDDSREERLEHSLPYTWSAQPDLQVGARQWRNIASTTSTFSARVGALRQDRDIFLQCMKPFRRRYLDHETCLIYQGNIPYRGTQLLTGLPGDFVPSLRGVVRTAVLVPFRVALNVRARRQRTPHYLYAVVPNLIAHLDSDMSQDQDWAAVAAQVEQWAERVPATGDRPAPRLLSDVE